MKILTNILNASARVHALLAILGLVVITSYQPAHAQVKNAPSHNPAKGVDTRSGIACKRWLGIVPDGYKVIDSALCDLNQDGYQDKILVLLANAASVAQQVQTGPQFYILKGTATQKFTFWDHNNNLLKPDDKCPADGYQKLVTKNNFFTIESSICGGWLYVHQFITFKYDRKGDKIVLHKYGEAYTDRTDPDKNIKPVVLDISAVEPVRFSQVTDEFIRVLRETQHKRR